MSYAVITTKIDPQTKKEAMEIAEKLGIPLSVVIKAFLKQFIRTKSIELSARDEEPSEYLKSVMNQAEENWKKGNHSPVFETGEEAVAWLEKTGYMKIVYDPVFINTLKKVNVRIRKSFKERVLLFSKNPHNLQLDNHALRKKYVGYRSIDITADYRAIYKERKQGEEIIAYFTELGIHEELYGE